MDGLPGITFEAILDRYEVLLFDAYGVLVHSEGALPGAGVLLATLNRLGKAYYMLTNDASKLPSTAASRYRSYGLALDAERIISSGALLKAYFTTHRLAGTRCAVLGPVDSARYVEQAGGQIVPPAEPFDVLVVGDESGFPFLETVDTALSTLCRMLDRQQPVHLVLPNPDIIYPSGEGFGIASGGVAMLFETALHARYPERTDLRFARLGKPYPAIFEEAVQRSGTRSMLMFGDQLTTDIQGARAFGLHAVLVGTGVTTAISPTLPTDLRPTYYIPSVEALLS